MKGFNMRGEVLAVFEVEFLLAAFFRWTSGVEALAAGVAQDFRAELLIDQETGVRNGTPCSTAALNPS